MISIICMVKNESEKIINTIQPFIDAGINNIFINDTGSDDNTVDVVRDSIKSAVIFQNNFIDFSTNRNIALNVAYSTFPDSKYFLFIDSEWYTKSIDKLIEFCNNNDENYDVNEITLLIDGKINIVPRLFKCNGNARFKGVVHEQVHGIIGPVVPFFQLLSNPTDSGYEKTINRIISYDIPYYLSIGENLSEDQKFHLAQSYFNIREYDKAVELYMQIKHQSLKYVSTYQCGIIFLIIGNIDLALKFFTSAILINKNRCEAYFRIAEQMRDKNKYDFAKIACECKINNHDVLNDFNILNYQRYIELAKGCLIVKKYKEGLSILDKLENNSEVKLLRIKLSRRIVILILNSPGYSEYNKILSEYLDNFDIEYYFYQYSHIEEDYIIEGHNIFLKGEETFIPGVLTKTIKVFEMFKEYDYIIRLNATTMIDLYKLDFDESIRHNNDFYGYLNSISLKLNESYGVTEEFLRKYGSFEFISGKCIILSKLAVAKLLENEIDYSVIDDVAISLVLNRYFKNEHLNSFGKDGIIHTITL